MSTRYTGAGVPGQRRVRGFTLIELMIAVAIVAILASIANASYQGFVIKSRRSAAAACLQERAQFMERYYTTHLSYAGAPAPAQCGPDLSPFYELKLEGVTTKTFTLLATPTDRQKDAKCGTLSITSTGARGSSANANAAECW